LRQGLINLPKQYSPSAYEEAVEEFVKKYSVHPDVLSIFQFGNVTVPGISDLDFLIILNDSLSAPLREEFSIQSFREGLRYLYNNTEPFLMTMDIFKEYWKIFPVSNLRLLYGAAHDTGRENRRATVIYEVLSLMDICNYFYPSVFLEQLYSKNLDVRRCLLLLNALCFPLGIMSAILPRGNGRWEEIKGRIKNLRSNWFQHDESEGISILSQLLEEASVVSIDLILSISKYVENNLWSVGSSGGAAATFFNVCFLNKFDPDEVLKNEVEYFKRGEWCSFLPASFLFPLIRYSQYKGVVSDHIKKNLKKNDINFNCFDNAAISIIDRRIGLMNRHAFFYQKNRIRIPMVHNYYSYNPIKNERDISSLFFNLMRKIS